MHRACTGRRGYNSCERTTWTQMMGLTFARLATKIAGNAGVHVVGLSGEIKDVFWTGKAELRFASFRQQNIDMLAFNLNTKTEHVDTRTSGLIGFRRSKCSVSDRLPQRTRDVRVPLREKERMTRRQSV